MVWLRRMGRGPARMSDPPREALSTPWASWEDDDQSARSNYGNVPPTPPPSLQADAMSGSAHPSASGSRRSRGSRSSRFSGKLMVFTRSPASDAGIPAGVQPSGSSPVGRSPLASVAESQSGSQSAGAKDLASEVQHQRTPKSVENWSMQAVGGIPPKRDNAKARGVFNPRRLIAQVILENAAWTGVAPPATPQQPAPTIPQVPAAVLPEAQAPPTPQTPSGSSHPSRRPARGPCGTLRQGANGNPIRGTNGKVLRCVRLSP